MVRKWLILMAASAVAAFGIAKAGPQDFGPQDLEKPEVYARAEDQERARLLLKPCTEADVGHGCYRFDNRALREMPCAYHIAAGVIGSLPTDQCFKMEKPRRYKGIWIDEFEGQAFIPEGTAAPEWPVTDPSSPGWREQLERARAATIWLNVARVKLRHSADEGGRKMFIDFIGRKTMYPGWYGHMGMSGSEIIVDRVISLKRLK